MCYVGGGGLYTGNQRDISYFYILCLDHNNIVNTVPRLSSWLNPPVEAHLTAYGFHVSNPEEVIKGGKPRLEEVGPFVYRAVTVKDSVDQGSGDVNLQYDQTGETLTYRPR